MQGCFIGIIQSDLAGTQPRQLERPSDLIALAEIVGIWAVHAHASALAVDPAAVQHATHGGEVTTGQPGQARLEIAPPPATTGNPTQHRFTTDERDDFLLAQGGKSRLRGGVDAPRQPARGHDSDSASRRPFPVSVGGASRSTRLAWLTARPRLSANRPPFRANRLAHHGHGRVQVRCVGLRSTTRFVGASGRLLTTSRRGDPTSLRIMREHHPTIPPLRMHVS